LIPIPLISASLIKKSINGTAIDKAILSGKIAMSSQTLEELTLVIFRKKFDKYFLNDIERLEIVDKIGQNSLLFEPDTRIFTIKEPVFSFDKFPDVDKQLGPEMKSTGEAIRFIKDTEDPYFRHLYKEKSMYLSK